MLSGWCPLGWVLGSGGWPGLPAPTARAMPWTAAHRRWEAPRRQRSGRRRSGCKPAAVILRISARQAAPGCVHPVNSGLHGPRRSDYLGCRVVMRAHEQYRQPRCLRGNAGVVLHWARGPSGSGSRASQPRNACASSAASAIDFDVPDAVCGRTVPAASPMRNTGPRRNRSLARSITGCRNGLEWPTRRDISGGRAESASVSRVVLLAADTSSAGRKYR